MKTYTPQKGGNLWRYAHVKRDGFQIRLSYLFGTYADNVNSFYAETRTGNCCTRPFSELLPRVKNSVVNQALTACNGQPHRAEVRGELFIAGGQASDVARVLCAKPDSSLRERVRFEVWYLSYCEGQPLPEAARLCKAMGLDFAPYFYNADYIGGDGAAAGRFRFSTEPSQLLQDIQTLGFDDVEGFVYKQGCVDESQCVKWKPVRTADLVCTGFTDGDGKFLGFIGSICGSAYFGDGTLREVAKASGMNDETRCDMTINEDNYVGRVFEVAYQSVGAGGRLRHPRFIRWRDEKPREECLADWNQE